MDGVHDLGGLHGFGRIPEDDSTFHEDWERTAFALSMLSRLQVGHAVDEKRYAVERIDPERYLSVPYFGRWILAEETLFTEKGILDADEIERRVAEIESGDFEMPQRSDPALVSRARATFEADRFSDQDDAVEPRFASGDEVVVKNQHPEDHHRAPRYTRRAKGIVRDHRGSFSLPNAAAAGEDVPEPVYSVEFTHRELWGTDGSESDTLRIDMWESYIQAADDATSTQRDQE